VRLVQLSVPAGKRETVRDVLEEEGIPYVETDETSDREYEAVIYMPLPAGMVESTLDTLEARGVSEGAYTVVISAETVISEQFDALEDGDEDDAVESSRISRQELQAEAVSLTPPFSVYVLMTVVSAVVATAGLLLDSPAVVVGSMVIAPLIGPALGASVGSVIDDNELLLESVKYQALGVGLAIAAAAAFAWLVRLGNVVPPGLVIAEVGEIEERLTPDLLSLAVALGAGVAGVVSIATGISVALVGVMIAAALIPPAAAAGIAIAWGEPAAAIGSTVLVFVNVLSVNLAGLITLWYLGYRPERLFQRDRAFRRVRKQVVGLVVVVLVFSTFLGAITYGDFTAATFEEDARGEAETLLATEEYAAYELIDIEVRLDDNFPFRSPERVVVTIGGPPDAAPVGIAAELEARISAHTDAPVAVEVRYVAVISIEGAESEAVSSASVDEAVSSAPPDSTTAMGAATLSGIVATTPPSDRGPTADR